MAATLYSPRDALPTKFAEIDAAWARVMAPRPKDVALASFIAGKRKIIATIIGKARSEREASARMERHNPGASRFYGDLTSHYLGTVQMHREHLNRARAELRALRAAERKAA